VQIRAEQEKEFITGATAVNRKECVYVHLVLTEHDHVYKFSMEQSFSADFLYRLK
jgi:hypothetical protein